jgi:hypothetical protein
LAVLQGDRLWSQSSITYRHGCADTGIGWLSAALGAPNLCCWHPACVPGG